MPSECDNDNGVAAAEGMGSIDDDWGGAYKATPAAWASSHTCMPIVFIHCLYSNPHPPQLGRVWVENNYPLKKWGG
jgi:hypothetical protein